MKFTRYSKFKGLDVSALNLGDLMEALSDQGLIDERQIQEMLADNDGKFKGSLLEEMLNQLIERLVEEGYLKLREEPLTPQQARQMRATGMGQEGEPLP